MKVSAVNACITWWSVLPWVTSMTDLIVRYFLGPMGTMCVRLRGRLLLVVLMPSFGRHFDTEWRTSVTVGI